MIHRGSLSAACLGLITPNRRGRLRLVDKDISLYESQHIWAAIPALGDTRGGNRCERDRVVLYVLSNLVIGLVVRSRLVKAALSWRAKFIVPRFPRPIFRCGRFRYSLHYPTSRSKQSAKNGRSHTTETCSAGARASRIRCETTSLLSYPTSQTADTAETHPSKIHAKVNSAQ